jgi:nitrogen fixation protein FixH
MAQISLKQQEAKTVRFTIKDKTGAAVDLTGSVCSFQVVSRSDYQVKLITKSDGDFGKTDADSGVLSLPLSATDLDLQDGVYDAELRIEFSSSNIDKSKTIRFVIEKAITD